MFSLRLIIAFLIVVISNNGLCDDVTQGIFIDKSKVVFSSHLNKITLRVANHTNDHYLLQAVMQNYDPQTGMVIDDDKEIPFIVSPPVHELRAGDESFVTLLAVPSRIILLPSSRESLFYLTLRLIPSEDKNITTPKLRLVHDYNIRVFWRPLTGNIEEKNIYFSCHNGNLIVSNDSGYYREVTQLFIDKYKVEKSILIRPVPPYGKLEINFPVQHCSPGEHQISWRFRDDFGVPSDLYKINF
ncbi:fimbria/pilus periplasmic chaperone [Escherichia coli]|nr:fimbria/pilus periplasmic chaperone [Escherichia coli]